VLSHEISPARKSGDHRSNSKFYKLADIVRITRLYDVPHDFSFLDTGNEATIDIKLTLSAHGFNSNLKNVSNKIYWKI